MTEEYEKVQIGNSQIRIPSSICSDRNTFQSIFSLETWNHVLEPEQRDRILEMLPPEVLSIPGAGLQTMEDLLSGNLARFGSSPLETFFNELNIGGFDPEVVKMKTGIKKHWRRDLLRRRKIYHTKLLQEVIISTETHLKQLTDKKSSQFLIPNEASSKPVKSVKASNQNLTKPKKNQKSGAAKPTPLRQRVAKRLHDEIAAINQAFNYSLSSSDEELPVTKKSLQTSKKPSKPTTTTKAPKKVTPKAGTKAGKAIVPAVRVAESSHCTRPMPTLTAIRTTAGMSSQSFVTTPSSSNLIRPTSVPLVLKIKEEQPTVKQVKSKIPPPPPYPGNAGRTSNLTAVSPSSAGSANHVPKSLQSKLSSTTPNSVVQIQIHSSNPIKSSPILASQLQAPISSLATKFNFITDFGSRTKPNPVIQQEVNKIRTGISDFPSQVMKLCLESEDEMESSSEDEFEAIEPTIGFTTHFPMLPTVSKIQQTKPTPKTTTSRSSTQGTNHKILPAKPKQVLYTVPKVSGSLTSASNTITLNKSIQNVHQLLVAPNVKIPNSHILLTSPSISVNKNPNITTTPSMKVISSPSEPYSLVPVAHSTPVSSTSVTSTAKLTTNLILTPNNSMVSATLVPISVQHGGLPKVQPARHPPGVFSASSTGMAILNGPSATSSVSNNPINNVVTSVSCASTTPTNNILQTKNSAPIIATTCVAMPHTHIVPTLNNVIRSATHLPMSLTDLSLSLGLDVGVDSKLGLDKIDDLSVLDGNPFDSIPNLSDELDGFDLDLVDGLCDFEVLLSEEKQYVSFFSLIREVLCSTQYHRMTLVCLEKTIRKWAITPTAALNPWFIRVNDWNEVLITSLNFLAGNYQDVHPEDFVPYIEYKYKTKYYQWIGAGRDSDTNLLQLCNMWLENLDRLPPLKKQDGENEEQEEEDEDNEDSDDHAEEVKKKYMRPKTPPPPRFVTDWTVRPSTTEEKDDFQEQERYRFDNPHKAFTYRMHSYESVVGPVKGVYSSQSGVTNKARGHSLLVDDRPPYVTILALVRDSVARLPNGEGTRSEICEMLRDSAFLAPEASNVTLNSVVSGALDRLHYERDPCVRYDSHKKNWIYLHRDRSQEQFERLHHNRSYTKSTKSRNNSSRKSRKKTTSQSSGAGQVNSINPGTQTNTGNDSSSTVPSSSSSVSSTPTSTPNLNIKSANPATTSATPSLVPSANNSTGPDSAHTSEIQNEILPASSISYPDGLTPPASLAPTPTIQFTIPASSGTTGTWSQAADPSKAPTLLQIQNLPNSGQTFTAVSSSAQTPSALVGTLRQPVTSGTNVISVVASHPTVTSTSNQQGVQFPTGQFIFGSNALLRLSSNVRLPEGVRFTQLRLPVQQNAPSNAVRIGQSQHRILLTRGAFPGQTQTQGVLLGQTANGQTLILSTASHIQNLQSQSGAQLNPITLKSNQPQQHTGFENTPVTQFNHNTVSSASVIALLNSSVNTSSTNVNVSNSISSTIPNTAQLQSQVISKKIAVTANGSHTPTFVNSAVATTGALMTQKSSSPSPLYSHSVSNASLQDQPLQQVQHLGQNVVSVAQVQAQIQQQSSSGSGPAPQLTSPFIIRSNQGDFMIPGHISLGRGMQGIKVIPVPSSSSGKQTVLARLVSPGPNQAAPPALHNQASQQ